MSDFEMSFSDKFNALPKRSRHLAQIIESEHRIIHLESEKFRIKTMCQKAIKEINKEIEYNQRELRKSREQFDEQYAED